MTRYAPGYTGQMLPAAPSRPTVQQSVSPRTNQPAPTPAVMADVRGAVRNVTPQQPTTRPPGRGTTGGPFNPSGGIKKTMKSGGKVSSASKRADGIATKGKTKGKIV